jgi:hypothetical protein
MSSQGGNDISSFGITPDGEETLPNSLLGDCGCQNRAPEGASTSILDHVDCKSGVSVPYRACRERIVWIDFTFQVIPESIRTMERNCILCSISLGGLDNGNS